MRREETTVASILMPIGEKWTVSRCRYTTGEGARVCIATGIHGDEMMGQLIVYGVARRIMDEPEHLHGTVDIYPMLNPLGLDIGERMVPSGTRLDMNRAFPGQADGTALESMCYSIMQDMLGADLVLDIHASTQYKSELYEVRITAPAAQKMMEQARTLCPELIWIYPDRASYNATLTGALSLAGTPAMILETDERRRHPQQIARRVIDGVFCKLADMGVWSGACMTPPASLGDIACVRSIEDICRVTCTRPGVYVPTDRIGKHVKAGDELGVVIDALRGETVETVTAPADGLVFSQRSYSAVYPGTLIARLCRKERA